MFFANQRSKFVTIQRPVSNSYGQPQAAFEMHSGQWAQVVTQSSPIWQRLWIGRPEVTHVVKLHSCYATRAITPAMRLLVDNQPLEVLSTCDPDGRAQDIQLNCRVAA